MSKRPLQRDSSPSSSSSQPPLKRQQASDSRSPSHAIKIHIVQAKLDSQVIYELFSLIDKNAGGLELERCLEVDDAEVIITAVHMRKRLERHLDWTVAKSKAIVTPQWLFDSVKHKKAMPCNDYAALHDLSNQESIQSKNNSPSRPDTSVQMLPIPSSSKITGNKLLHTSRFACSRISPLVCPNQDLVAELAIIRRSRELEGEERSALSYSRAIAVIKAYPHKITEHLTRTEVVKLPYIGTKLETMIQEYLRLGHINESQSILETTRYHSLVDFTSVYGIGPTNARKLYDLGLRNISDLERYYEADQGELVMGPEGDGAGVGTQREEMSIKVALRLREDLMVKIPRDEVNEMHRVVMYELDFVQKGCVSTICGGYRRGKQESSDVDIVITHPDLKSGSGVVKGLCRKLVKRLYEEGLVTHVMHLSGFHAYNSLRTSQWDSLEKALTVFLLPADNSFSSERRLHRRLDLIFAAPEVYWTAITGWTGSTMFERDLRLWAKEKGMKFDSSGITRRRDSKAFYPKTEREVFEVFGLEWVDPILRNADA